MKSIATAYEALEARKVAAFGEKSASATYSEDRLGVLAIIGGFDVDSEELFEVAHRAGHFSGDVIAHSNLPQRAVISAIWIDAFVTGLLFGNLPEEEEDGTNPFS